MLLIWFLCRKFLQNKNPKLVYYMLRWIVMMYLLPITYFAIKKHYENAYIQDMEGVMKMLFVVNLNNLLYQGLAVIWLITIAVVGAYFIKNEIGKILICRNNFDDGESLTQTEFERIKKVLGIRGRVSLFHNDTVGNSSPFVTGIFHRKVIIPFGEYTEEELKVILYHELTHIKKSDVLFRYLAMAAIIINSINPFVYLLWKAILLWSEADCDARAIDALEQEGIRKRDYYRVIWGMLESGSVNSELLNYPMLSSAAKSLFRRMEIMDKYRANMKKMAKSATFIWALIFAMFSSVTAHAAGIDLAEANDEMLKVTQELQYYSDEMDLSGSWSEIKEVETSDTVDIVYINEDIMILGNGTFNWSVPVGTRYVTSGIYLTEGTHVQVACTASPSDCLYWFGIMHPTSTCSIVEGTGAGSCTFEIPYSGYYRVMVENRGNVVLNAAGSYTY